ncbi:MAG: ChaN family lipoprotein [Candidatus Riflebacteria bacterium]|nr:ChaN family lipoprotein [Candidatus Riflebacteria bacterium]
MRKIYLQTAILLAIALVAVLAVANAAEISKDEFKRLRQVEVSLQQQISEMEAELKTSTQLEKYKKSYLAAVPAATPRPLSDSEMAKIIAGARYVFMGDEHTTNQAQINTSIVLGMMRASKEPVTLVIEWVDISFQKEIDAFLAGRLPLKELRAKISFDKLWGFSWSSYSKILSNAKRLKAPILLVERLKASHSLADRDSFITATIANHAKQAKNMRYLVVYGDYHTLGAGHLSQKMAQAGFKPQTILIGDAAETYWKLLGKIKDPAKIGFADLGGGTYYIRNGTPLERSLSYRNYLMKMVGFKKGDFEEWIGPDDIVPQSASRSNFETLHNP